MAQTITTTHTPYSPADAEFTATKQRIDNLFGSATDWTPAWGGRPSVPNPVGTAQTSLAGNIGNLGLIYSLAGGLNKFNQASVEGQYKSAIPNYAELAATQSGVVGSELKGELPGDVVTQILNQAAERGVMTGSPGSPNANAAMLRAMGLTSLDMTGRGIKDLATTIQGAPKAGIIDPTQFLVTPGQQQDAQMGANLYASAPVPSAAAAESLRIAGAGFGAGAGGGPRSSPLAMPATPSPWDTGYGTVSWGEGSQFGETAPDPVAEWQKWAAGISTGQGTGSAWSYDPAVGASYNPETGDISDTPGGAPWSGFNYYDPEMTGAGATEAAPG